LDEEKLYKKLFWRIAPLAVLGYVIAYIDRVNVGFAKLQFLQDLGFSDTVFGLGAGLFFVGYFIFEVPSNLLLEKMGARLTLMRIMVLWGVLSAGMAFVQTPMQFYTMRFLLGAAEAGFFPGIILYLSYWFPESRRGRITAFFTMGASIAGIVGGPLSGWLMSLDGLHGLRGWQILFIYEGLPAALLGIVYYLSVSNGPDSATWLTPVEKQHIAQAVAAENKQAKPGGKSKLAQVFKEPKVYVLALAYLSILAGTQAVALWTPTLLKTFGIDIKSIGWLSALPYVISVILMFLLGRSSDRHMERRWHFAVAIWVAAASLIFLSLAGSSAALTIAMLALVAGGSWAALAVFWTIPPGQLSPEAKAGGIAFISSAGAIGGFVSPVIVGWSSKLTGSLYGGLSVIGGMLLISGLIILLFTRKEAIRA
jgi:ACS family phthalate transporter-like MFS transporter